MPRYYCDYCDTYLTHDSPSVRKQHNAGYKHKANVREYYQRFEAQQTQILIDQKIKEHLGQSAAFQQIGAVYNPLASFPGNAQVPRAIPPPVMPLPRPPQLMQGVRPPVLPVPFPVPGAPGFGPAPMGILPPAGPLGASPSLPMQSSGLPNPPAANSPAPGPGGVGTVSSSNAIPATFPQAAYQANPTGTSGPSASNPAGGGYSYAPPPQTSQ